METIEMKVTGMTCHHCVMAVTKALKGVHGVQEVAVDLDRGEAVVRGTPDSQALIDVVEAAGYRAEMKK
ncbi:heavy-metal-associated domain-containing protein [Acidithiobacillus ferrianus]|uniref:Heavy metal-binding protein n=2 Tax=Acidithiobacillus ferrianus TaxID=2678518 RepID=A0A845U7Q2_9PROT|nr:heavy-metal-associated domain-containing protein [Acidithiobacillus ferrianus]NDU41787.1 heavy metal-binding protein [Acidithiobacillus ferrianus]